MVFKEGFLTTPFIECHGCPGAHTFKEGVSHSVHRGCPGTHTFKEGLSYSVHFGCTGTDIFWRQTFFSFSFSDQYMTVFMHIYCFLFCLFGFFFCWNSGLLQRVRGKGVYVSMCVCGFFSHLRGFLENVRPFVPRLRFFFFF